MFLLRARGLTNTPSAHRLAAKKLLCTLAFGGTGANGCGGRSCAASGKDFHSLSRITQQHSSSFSTHKKQEQKRRWQRFQCDANATLTPDKALFLNSLLYYEICEWRSAGVFTPYSVTWAPIPYSVFNLICDWEERICTLLWFKARAVPIWHSRGV